MATATTPTPEDKKPAEVSKFKVGDKATYGRSGTVVEVTKVCEDGSVDVQESGHKKRYWGGVKASALTVSK